MFRFVWIRALLEPRATTSKTLIDNIKLLDPAANKLSLKPNRRPKIYQAQMVPKPPKPGRSRQRISQARPGYRPFSAYKAYKARVTGLNS